MSKGRNRAISWIVLVIFSLVIFCSSAFIIVHADHDCTGEDCSVCMELAECHKTLNTLEQQLQQHYHLRSCSALLRLSAGLS